MGPATLSQEALDRLGEIAFDPQLLAGARNAMRTCLGVTAGQEVTLIVDADPQQAELGAALLAATKEITPNVRAYLLVAEHARVESLVKRLLERLSESDASVLVSGLGSLPVDLRRRIIDVGGPRRRHAHLLGLTTATFAQGMRADYEEVARLGERLLERLVRAKELSVTTSTGTDLRVRVDPSMRWHHESGLLRSPGWLNLPSGEITTTPGDVEGVCVPDGGVWSVTEGALPRALRLRLELRGSRVVAVSGRDEEARARFVEMIDGDANGRRVGQFGFGTNIAVLAPVGSLLQDQRMPGVHLQLGEPHGTLTGAAWRSSVEVPMVVRRPDVWIDGEPVMVRGKYVAALLA